MARRKRIAGAFPRGALLLVLGVPLCPAVEASAQAAPRTPAVEIGGGLGRLFTMEYDDFGGDLAAPTGDVLVSVPVGRRFALEGILTIGRRANPFSTRTEGIYIVQVRQSIERWTRGRRRVFVTYGG